MKVNLRNPDRVIEATGPRVGATLLKELDIVPDETLAYPEWRIRPRAPAIRRKTR